MIPRTSGTTARQLITIHVTLSATANPTRQAPSVTKKAIFLARPVIRIREPYRTILDAGRTEKKPRREALRGLYLISETSLLGVSGLVSRAFLRHCLFFNGIEGSCMGNFLRLTKLRQFRQ